ncbi:hypothetical protein LMG33818_000118 [Halomonadaceae bacterium LMG 33818]
MNNELNVLTPIFLICRVKFPNNRKASVFHGNMPSILSVWYSVWLCNKCRASTESDVYFTLLTTRL